MNKLLILLFLFINTLSTIAQTPPEEFLIGLDLLDVDVQKAKKEFEIAQKKDSLFPGSYHFLGVIALEENNIDSAIINFEKALFLNMENINHTREMTLVRLIDIYLQRQDFHKAFDLAYFAYKHYSYNNVILHALQDICLWSFYIKHNGLDSSYLSTELKDEYLVNSIAEEYLILRNIWIDGNFLMFKSQRLVKKKRKFYDIVTCSLSDSDETVEVKFRLNWDLDEYISGKVVDTEQVYANKENPIYERIGALLVSDAEIDLNKEIKKLYDEDK